jgi:methylated-DNA-[protein]-cysteine S-methyltransferase
VLELASMPTPIGRLMVAAHDDRLCLVHFDSSDTAVRKMLARWYPDEPVKAARDPAGAVAVLTSYFEGEVGALDGVQVEMNGTPFQLRVWGALRSVRAGVTASYMDIARRIRAPKAVRAVGAANGANPIPIVVPCHRIIGSSGSLTGYGGGLDRKRWLLRHEGGPRLF